MKSKFLFFMQQPPNFTPEQQQEITRYQQIQQSLEMLMQQKSTLEARLAETDFAVKELEKVDDNAVVYRAVGGLMIKKSRSDILEASKDQQETLAIRVKSLGEQEKRLKVQFDEQKKKIQTMMGAPTS